MLQAVLSTGSDADYNLAVQMMRCAGCQKIMWMTRLWAPDACMLGLWQLTAKQPYPLPTHTTRYSAGTPSQQPAS